MTELDDLRSCAQRGTSWPDVPTNGGVAVRRAADRRTRRNRAVLVGAATVAVGVVVLSPATLNGVLDSERAVDPSPVSGPPAQEGLDVADGYRPVGALGLVFEVPNAWATNEVACDGSPVADTVAFGFGRDCQILDPPTVSSLLITKASNRLVASDLDRLELTPTRIDDLDVEVSEPARLDDWWAFAVADASGDVAVMKTLDEAVARHAYRALRTIPDGYVTIPLLPRLTVDEVLSRLEGLGLVPVTSGVEVEGAMPGSVVGTEPPVASVVRIGSEIIVRRASG